MRLRNDLVKYYPNIRGQFGCKESRLWTVTFGMNTKGGMDDEEFQQYLINSIFPLFPDAKDRKGLRVLLKVDSGPGRLNMALLYMCRRLGFIPYPGVPNTTAVSQETDRNYGPFKTSFRQILGDVIEHRITSAKTTTMPPWIVGLVVFGGTDPETNHSISRNAFQDAFNVSSNLNAWAKFCAAPCTRACLFDPQVRRTLHDSGPDDETSHLMLKLNKANEMATFTLSQAGYCGNHLKVQCVKETVLLPITEPHSKERIELMAKASSHGQKFLSTGGQHVTSDDFFKAAAVAEWDAKIKALEVRKTACARHNIIVEEGREILVLAKPIGTLTKTELAKLLLWYTGETDAKQGLKAKKVQLWTAIVNNPEAVPVVHECWTT